MRRISIQDIISIIILLIGLFYIYKGMNQPKIDLPEEYELINPHEQLQGNYDKSTNTLHIWFNNK